MVSFASIGAVASAACGTSGPSSADAGGDAASIADTGSPADAPTASPDADASSLHAAGGGVDGATDAPPGATASDAAVEGGTTYTMKVTFYGWADNSPPGDAIAYPMNGGFPTVHDAAGGTGTFADPITFATDKAEIPVGTIIYIPFIEKYLVMEDDCTECDQDWSNGMERHVDVWMNSNGTANATDLENCEDQWTQESTSVEVDAPAGRVVTTAPLFDPSANVCRSTP
jgi:3D (Asp-Asp-Asp) domain-containing protein